MKITLAYSTNNISLKSKSKLSEKIVNSSFQKLALNRKFGLGRYYGTTVTGENIAIEELSLAKKAKLFIQKYTKNDVTNEIYELCKMPNGDRVVLSETGKKIVSEKRLEQINSQLDNLK